nr:hypothetical protein Iba_chr03fCG2660 [Ipomoea batatas]
MDLAQDIDAYWLRLPTDRPPRESGWSLNVQDIDAYWLRLPIDRFIHPVASIYHQFLHLFIVLRRGPLDVFVPIIHSTIFLESLLTISFLTPLFHAHSNPLRIAQASTLATLVDLILQPKPHAICPTNHVEPVPEVEIIQPSEFLYPHEVLPYDVSFRASSNNMLCILTRINIPRAFVVCSEVALTSFFIAHDPIMSHKPHKHSNSICDLQPPDLSLAIVLHLDISIISTMISRRDIEIT